MSSELTVSEQNSFIAPVVDIQSALARYKAFREFVKQVLVEGTDYGKVPGTDKDTLLKPGAEKLGAFFGLRPIFLMMDTTDDWTGKDHNGETFFYRQYKSQLYRSGELVGEGIGSCNSWEKKYRYRWMNELEIPANVDKSTLEYKDGVITEFAFAIDKAETSGKYGKPAEYWKQFNDAINNGTARQIKRKTKKGDDMPAWEIGGKLYAVPNKDVSDQVNTIDKMAQKRAFVAAILIATNASDYFTQDLEDFTGSEQSEPIEGRFIDKKSEPKPKFTRPFSPAELKEQTARKVEKYAVEQKPVTEADSKKLIANLSQLTQDDDILRHALTNFLVGKESTKSMTGNEIHALNDWINAKPDSGGAFVIDGMAAKEYRRIVDEVFAEGEGK